MTVNPKIVCLMMVTGAATAQVGETIASFNKQIYPNKELIILDTHPQAMGFNVSAGQDVNYYPVPRAKFDTLESKMKYALFLATVREADYVAFWSPGDIFFPWHLSDLAGKIPNQFAEACTSPYPYRIGHLNGFLMKDPEVFINPNQKVYLTHGSEAPQLSGYIFQHFTGHSVDWDAKNGAPQVAYSKIPWHTILLGPPHVPGYIEVWNTEKALFAGWFAALSQGRFTQESLFERSELFAASFPKPAAVTVDHWRYNYEALALGRWKQIGNRVDIPAGTISLWPEGWRLGADNGCVLGSCGRVAGDLDRRDVLSAREPLSD